MRSKAPLPILVRSGLIKLGRDIQNARKRRKITTSLMAERASITRVTLAKIEKGNPSVAIGLYATVLFVLGMKDALKDLVDFKKDEIGQMLEEENLPKRVRLKTKKVIRHE